MPLDPELKSFLDKLKKKGLPDITQMTAPEARQALDEGPFAIFPVVRDTFIDIRDQIISVENTRLPIRIYTPKEVVTDLPGLIYLHGGGFVVGTLEAYDHLCVSIARKAKCTVVSVGYRLAPEFPFPTPPEDCYNAALWIVNHAKELRLQRDKIFIGGDSAGGCLATVVTLMARDRSSYKFQGQILLYPVIDRNFSTTSYLAYAHTYLTRAVMMWFWQQYLPDKSYINTPYAVPAKANSLNGLPEALVITAECDPLHDEGADYADHLKQAHSLYDYHNYRGMVHGFALLADAVPSARKATDNMISRIAIMINS